MTRYRTPVLAAPDGAVGPHEDDGGIDDRRGDDRNDDKQLLPGGSPESGTRRSGTDDCNPSVVDVSYTPATFGFGDEFRSARDGAAAV